MSDDIDGKEAAERLYGEDKAIEDSDLEPQWCKTCEQWTEHHGPKCVHCYDLLDPEETESISDPEPTLFDNFNK